MRTFYRLKQTLSASFDSFLDQVENQEAVVLATIREVEQGGARIRAHRKGCERRIQALTQHSEELERQTQIWRERALRLRDDRDKALECVRRMHAAERARSAALAELERQQALLQNIREDEAAVDDKLAELKRRHSQLSSRDARSSVQGGVECLDHLDRVFDRWEARIEQREVATEGRVDAGDVFAHALSREEEIAAANAELDRLLSEEQV